jgi:hypothetical protein
MNLKRLTKYIIILGTVVWAIGLAWVLVNHPVSSETNEFIPSEGIRLMNENWNRAAARSNGLWVMLVGGIVAVGGMAVSRSSRSS